MDRIIVRTNAAMQKIMDWTKTLELRTCYCPLCDKHFEVRSNDSMGDCPDCGHHVVLHEVEVAE